MKSVIKIDYTMNKEIMPRNMAKYLLEHKLSQFPASLCDWLINFYSKKNNHVLDVFTGVITRMVVTSINNRRYTGYDINKRTVLLNRRHAKKRRLKNVIIHNRSSEKLLEKNNSIDFILSSPPYYKTEKYSNDKKQLYNSHNYNDFMCRMNTIIKECYRVLKLNKFMVLNVADFRHKKQYYDFHNDIIRVARYNKFILHDLIIMQYPNVKHAGFKRKLKKQMLTAKSHEYILVFRKEL